MIESILIHVILMLMTIIVVIMIVVVAIIIIIGNIFLYLTIIHRSGGE